MNKSDWYKLFAIGIVAAFAIEGIALGVLQGDSGTGRGNGGTGTGGGLDITGQASGNVTIVRYEPYLIVSAGTETNAAAIGAVKQKLIDDGVATYAVPNGENIIVNLASSRSAVAAAAEFEKVNATAIASIVISTPSNLKVTGGDGVTTTAESSSFRMQAKPIYDEGSIVPATFVAQVQQGQLTGIGSFSFLPTYVAGALAEAIVNETGKSAYAVEVLWQDRVAAKPIAKEAGAIYRERSFIAIPQNATQQQVAALQQAGQEYATGVQQGIVSVKNDFVDSLRAAGDLQNAGLAAIFPTSYAYFENASGNDSSVALLSKLKEANVTAKISESRSIKVKLPDFVEKDGSKYATKGEIISIEQTEEAMNGTVWLLVDFEAAGSRVARIISVRQVEAPIVLPVEPVAEPSQNWTDKANAAANASGG